nr:hypothetical protein Iba_chr15bCG8580 [Ipomoea batatas]
MGDTPENALDIVVARNISSRLVRGSSPLDSWLHFFGSGVCNSDGSLEIFGEVWQRSFSAACPSPRRDARKQLTVDRSTVALLPVRLWRRHDDGTSTPFLSSVQWIQQRDMVKQQQQMVGLRWRWSSAKAYSPF